MTKKKEEKPKDVEGAALLPKGPGPAMQALASKLRAEPSLGGCDVIGCKNRATSPRAWRCGPHKKAIRKAQLKANNAVWRKRVKEGKAGHHVVYKGYASVFSLKNTKVAEKIVTSGRSTLKTRDEFREVLRKVPESVKKEVKAAK